MDKIAILGAGISAVATSSQRQVFYQLLQDGHIDERKNRDGIWEQTNLPLKPAFASPLASVAYLHEGNQKVHVYYLDTEYFLQEFIYIKDRGWHQGEIGQKKARATPTAGIGALTYSDHQGRPCIRVYYQDAETNSILEFVNDGYWHPGVLNLGDALGGTNIAAVSIDHENQTQFHVYYQAKDLSLKEHHRSTRDGWSEGDFNPGKAAAQTPISALAFGVMQFQLYWRDLDGHIVVGKYSGIPCSLESSIKSTNLLCCRRRTENALTFTSRISWVPWLSIAATTVARPGMKAWCLCMA